MQNLHLSNHLKHITNLKLKTLLVTKKNYRKQIEAGEVTLTTVIVNNNATAKKTWSFKLLRILELSNSTHMQGIIS